MTYVGQLAGDDWDRNLKNRGDRRQFYVLLPLHVLLVKRKRKIRLPFLSVLPYLIHHITRKELQLDLIPAYNITPLFELFNSAISSLLTLFLESGRILPSQFDCKREQLQNWIDDGMIDCIGTNRPTGSYTIKASYDTEIATWLSLFTRPVLAVVATMIRHYKAFFPLLSLSAQVMQWNATKFNEMRWSWWNEIEIDRSGKKEYFLWKSEKSR